MARLDDGFSTTVNIGVATLYEKDVTPVGVEGGGANDVTTMRNTAWRTRAPKKLKTLGEMSFVAAYDPAVYNNILTVINVKQTITITFPDSSTKSFSGWLNEFKPNRVVEGEQPTADVTIIAALGI